MITKLEADNALIAIVKDEVTKYDMGQYWITDKVAFNMRELIKEFRKNYWGIYDIPVDPITKREKLWVPLTRTLCDAVRKSVDLDPKDVRFRSLDMDYAHLTNIIRGSIREYFRKIYFGHELNQLTTTIVIDGTDVWKTYYDGENLQRKDVDLLNVYIDPTADSIQSAYRFTERILMSKSEVKGMDWENLDAFKVSSDMEKEEGSTVKKAGQFGDVYEMWGKIPKWVLTLEDTDRESGVEIDGHVVISGIDTGSLAFHLVEENTNKDAQGNIIKPYEEAWYLKVPGRWYGVGIAETIMQLQWWINTVVNLRINKNTIAQLGLLKIRKGSGVTQQMLSNLISKGVIELADPADLEQLAILESGQSSYEDEKTARQWAQDVTSVFDISLGELPASTSATGASIQSQEARSAFSLVTESIEHFVQRWIDRHVMVHVPKMLKNGDKVTLFKDFENIKELRETVISNMVHEEMEKMYKKTSKVPTEQEVQVLLDKMTRKLEKRGDLIVENLEEMIVEGMITEVFMTNADMDIGTTVRNLLELRNGLDPQTSAEMTAQALDLLGLEVPKSLRNPQQPAQGGQADPNAITSDVQQVTAANTMNSQQM
jgi:hypothetical protein